MRLPTLKLHLSLTCVDAEFRSMKAARNFSAACNEAGVQTDPFVDDSRALVRYLVKLTYEELAQVLPVVARVRFGLQSVKTTD